MDSEIKCSWSRIGLITLSVAVLLTAAACSTGEAETRRIVEQSGTKITVMDNTSESVYTKLQLEGIDKIEHVRGLDWADEDSIVVDKENRALKPETVEGQERYPHNLYLRDLPTGGETPLAEGSKNYGAAQLSPDRTHLLYMEMEDFAGFGFIMDLETGRSVKVNDMPFRSEEGKWADNGHFIFPDMEGAIRKADVNGTQETVVKPEGTYVHEVVQSGNTVYYVMGEDMGLYAYNTETQESREILQNVAWVIPSPDGSRLAIVKRTEPGEMVLMLTDTEGNEQQSRLAAGQQIYGTSWSPDGSKLAYSLTAADAGSDQDGVFITEVETGEQTQILSDIEASNPLRWSPSGKKLLAASAVLKDDAYQAITYVIRLS
ncbi:hypothetical protein C2I18_13430 [Paenibacillus sp. PK3_47]|uniref:TolB family protein n=1 Tax=Paenibacillus sp. PK3_47 TaxID=2072642 RepID=UPI00201DEFB5|nr:hypothetical protein [Paenibacillus sp. PK3_47]UQZ34433.1 hypothetical protein C2I18_13430 [Paenibacillus sp. PK3_47]